MTNVISRRRFVGLAATTPAFLGLPYPLFADDGPPEPQGPFIKPCDVRHAFLAKPGSHPRVGLVTKLTLGDLKAKTPFQVPNPENPGRNRRCVAVIEHIAWDGTPTGQINITCRIPGDLKADVVRVFKEREAVDASIQFRVWDYDADTERYYRSFYSAMSDLDFELSETDFNLEDDPEYDVPDPENYEFEIGLRPSGDAQDLHVAVSSTGKFVKQWGISGR